MTRCACRSRQDLVRRSDPLAATGIVWLVATRRAVAQLISPDADVHTPLCLER